MKFVYLSLAVLLSACAQDDANTTPKPAEPTQAKIRQPVSAKLKENKVENQTITVKGTVLFKEFEGGFWALDAEDGKKYMPYGIGKAHQKQGLVVEVTGMILHDMLTTQQYGQVLKIRSVKILHDPEIAGSDEI